MESSSLILPLSSTLVPFHIQEHSDLFPQSTAMAFPTTKPHPLALKSILVSVEIHFLDSHRREYPNWHHAYWVSPQRWCLCINHYFFLYTQLFPSLMVSPWRHFLWFHIGISVNGTLSCFEISGSNVAVVNTNDGLGTSYCHHPESITISFASIDNVPEDTHITLELIRNVFLFSLCRQQSWSDIWRWIVCMAIPSGIT